MNSHHNNNTTHHIYLRDIPHVWKNEYMYNNIEYAFMQLYHINIVSVCTFAREVNLVFGNEGRLVESIHNLIIC